MAETEKRSELVIGLTGPVGSGVTSVSRVLEERGFQRASLSKPMKDALRLKVPLDPETPINEQTAPGFRALLQNIGNEGRQKSLSHWVDAAIADMDTGREIVIDGIRNLGEVRALRDRFRKFFLIAVHAATDTRWKRVETDYDQNLKNFQRDDLRDQSEGVPFGQQVGKCVQDADYVLSNDEQFHNETIRTRIEEVLLPDLDLMRDLDGSMGDTIRRRPPTPQEGHMAAAYSESHISQCMKRHVGAIIVSEDGRPLSMGYNENPFRMKPCVADHRICFKDADMHDKLSKMPAIFCPNCGITIDRLESPWLCTGCGDNLKLRFFPDRNMQLCTAIHAEERAISSLDGRSARGGTLFTTTFPCFQCARKIVDAEISTVVFVEAYPIREAHEFLLKNGVVVVPFQGFKARAFNLVFRQVE